MSERVQFESYDIGKVNARYISGKSLADGTTIRGAILGVRREVVGDESKDVLYLEGVPQGLCLNSTNRKYLVAKLGAVTGNWAGALIEIYGAEGAYKGEPCTVAKVRLVQ
ncbi:MAG: hypothetical protein WC683_07060 [bacterium]